MTDVPPGQSWAAPVPEDLAPAAPPTGWQTPAPSAPPPPPPPGAAAAPGVSAPITFRSWQPGIVALRPLPFGDFITVPFRAMRFNRGAIVGGPLLLFSLASILTAGAVWLAFTDDQLQLTSATSSFDGIESVTVVGVMVAVIAWVVADLFASTVVIPAVSQAVLGERLSLGSALRQLASRFWPLAVFGLILGAAATILLLFCMLPLLTSIGEPEPSDGAIGGALILTFLVWVPAAIVSAPYIPVARAAIIMERVGPIAAISRAVRLVSGRFWWSFLIIFVVGVINWVVQQVFSFATQMVALIAAAISPDLSIGFAVALILGSVLQILATVVVQYSFVGSTLALIYLDLRIRKEGLAFDLAKAAEANHARRGGTI